MSAVTSQEARLSNVLRFTWPTVASCLCSSAFRVNDQFWVGGLGEQAQAALGAATFVMILNFALYFLAVAGCMSRVARASGAGDDRARNSAIHHGFALATILAVVVGGVGYLIAPEITSIMGLSEGVAAEAVDYIRGTYLVALPIAFAPLLDNVFISMGDTRSPFVLQVLSIGLNFIFNPLFIYGGIPALQESPQVWLGVQGAAFATGLSRAIAIVIGLIWLVRRKGIPLLPESRIAFGELVRIVRTGLPSCVSIAIYALVYVGLTRWVFSEFSDAALAGFSVGFNAFEAVSYPLFLGIALGGSAMVGRALGARNDGLAQELVRSTRTIALLAGVLITLAFLFVGPYLVPAFTSDTPVIDEAILYLRILAISQIFVALETVSENVHMAAGHTRPIFWISVPGNLARVPLGILFALTWGFGPAGLWWAINATTLIKALIFHWLVVRERWLRDPHLAGS
ncbi:MAG: MATE family efflux transporter [Planctomycetota bacterium]|nr:MATE family efflux transporter [Planctomycetota bacterium]